MIKSVLSIPASGAGVVVPPEQWNAAEKEHRPEEGEETDDKEGDSRTLQLFSNIGEDLR